jgi:hypothetical protein
MKIPHPHSMTPLHVTTSGHRLINVTHMHETPHPMAPRAMKTSGAPGGYRPVSGVRGTGKHSSPYERVKSMSPSQYSSPYSGKHRRV